MIRPYFHTNMFIRFLIHLFLKYLLQTPPPLSLKKKEISFIHSKNVIAQHYAFNFIAVSINIHHFNILSRKITLARTRSGIQYRRITGIFSLLIRQPSFSRRKREEEGNCKTNFHGMRHRDESHISLQ